MSSISYPLAFFLAISLETLLVGVFIPLFLVAIYAQWQKVSRGQKLNKVMAFTTVFFGLVIPFHWILGARGIVLAALYRPPGVSMEDYLSFPYDTCEIIRRDIFRFSIVVGDFVMIYRIYHIYDKSFLPCIIPALITAGQLATSCGLAYSIRFQYTPSQQKANRDWIQAALCVTLFNSVFMSTAICLRLWRVHRQTAVAGANLKSSSVALRAMRVLVESAGLWTFFVFMNFVNFLAKSNLRFTFFEMTSPAVGISFCLIIVRLGTVTTEIRENIWDSSERSRPSRLPTDSRFSKISVPLDRVKVERDVYVSDAESGIHIQMNQMSSSVEKASPVD